MKRRTARVVALAALAGQHDLPNEAANTPYAQGLLRDIDLEERRRRGD